MAQIALFFWVHFKLSRGKTRSVYAFIAVCDSARIWKILPNRAPRGGAAFRYCHGKIF